MKKKTEDNITGTTTPEAPQIGNGQSNSDNKSEQSQAPKFEREEVKAAPITEATNRIFILSNDKRQGTVQLDVEEDVIDPKTNKPRRMRLLRGAPSIWFDEKPPSVYPKEYVNKNVLSLDFNKGVCIVPVNDPLRIQAAELTNRNVATKKKNGAMAKTKDIYFYEWNPAEINKASIAEENDVIKAMQLAMTVPVNEMIPHASYLNIPTSDEQGVPFDDDAMRTAYIRMAKNNATKFLKSIQSPVVKIAHMIRKGVREGQIDLGTQPGAAYWVDGGFICALPEGRDAEEYLTEYAMTFGDKSEEFASQLRTLLG